MFSKYFRLNGAAAVCAAALGIATLGHSPDARCDVVLDWNAIALRTTMAAPRNPPLETRNVALVHAAIYDAVNATAGGKRQYAVTLPGPKGASPEAAVVAAAHAALVELYPAFKAQLDADYAASLETITDGAARRDGIKLGENVAAELLRLRADDGAVEAVLAKHESKESIGEWRPMPPNHTPALAPGWATVRPFLIESASQFRPGPPPALDSAEYARDFAEILDIGSAKSKTRTQRQTQIAKMWMTPAAPHWNAIARQAAAAAEFSLAQNAHAFALMNIAGADAFIAAYDAKYTYRQWRPVTAIPAAADDGNDATQADAGWMPLIETPAHPDYIAAHASYAGAASTVLAKIFGDAPGIRIAVSGEALPDVVEHYERFSDIAADVENARVWGGVHWRTSCVRGREVGARVAQFAIERFAGAPAAAAPTSALP